MAKWRHALVDKWSAIRFGEVKVETAGELHLFEVQMYLNYLDPEAVRLELYAEGIGGAAPVRLEMKCFGPMTGAAGGYIYRAEVSAARKPDDYTARLIPSYPGVAVPLEAAQILWKR
jgi:starch phosphorylase